MSNITRVLFPVSSYTSHTMPIEITQTRTNQGLLVDGGGIHQEPREIEAPRGKTRSEFKFDGWFMGH